MGIEANRITVLFEIINSFIRQDERALLDPLELVELLYLVWVQDLLYKHYEAYVATVFELNHDFLDLLDSQVIAEGLQVKVL